MNAIALDVSDLHPSATLGDMPMLWTVLAVAVAAAAACAVAMTLYGRRTRRPDPRNSGSRAWTMWCVNTTPVRSQPMRPTRTLPR